jgi:hypothetical protein
MIDRYNAGDAAMKPDVIVYTILIKACAHNHGTPEEKRKALEMALDAIVTLENSEFGPPNEVAYSTLMTAICRLSESTPQRERFLEAAFRKCADKGLVSINVVREIGSRRLFRKVTNNTNQLHPDWSKNVPAKDKPIC